MTSKVKLLESHHTLNLIYRTGPQRPKTNIYPSLSSLQWCGSSSHDKILARMRHTLVVRGGSTHYVLAILNWSYCLLLFACSPCAPLIFLPTETLFFYFVCLLSMNRLIFGSCCCWPGWFHRTWYTSCCRTTSLHRLWRAVITCFSFLHHLAFAGHPESSQKSPCFFPTLSRDLQALLLYLTLVVFACLSIVRLCPVWMLNPRLEVAWCVEYFPLCFCFSFWFWFHIFAPQWFSSADAFHARHTYHLALFSFLYVRSITS